MLNKLTAFLEEQNMVSPGDRVTVALSGGPDSVALLFALYLQQDRLGIRLEAAHFNHRLRGEESDADEAFVKELCFRYDIPLHLGSGPVVPGKKGLEAAARDARYRFLRSLPGKIATAHTADDNAETVLMHLLRGTGLKGLGGITPVSDKLIRPMLTVTRQEVEAFLAEWNLTARLDSSNEEDAFLRNRLRHHVMPLLRRENPRLAQNLSAAALRLRQDGDYLDRQARYETLPKVEELKTLHSAVRSRMLERFLKENGVPEPEQIHIHAVEQLLYSGKPSARADLPGGITVARCYETLTVIRKEEDFPTAELPCPGTVELPGLRVTCEPAGECINTPEIFTVYPRGKILLRCRQSGDSLRLPGGTKSLKKLFIDRKIPAHLRLQIPVAADSEGILGVYGIGPNLDRVSGEGKGVTVRFEKLET